VLIREFVTFSYFTCFCTINIDGECHQDHCDLCISAKHSANVCLPEFAWNVRADVMSKPIR